MNKVGSLIQELHDAEVAPARDYRRVGERHAVEHDMWYGCHTLAKQCEARVATLRPLAERYDQRVAEPHDSELLRSLMAHVRHATSAALGRRPSAGLLMLRDLRHLHASAEEVNFYWLILGQVAQAKRDAELLETVDVLHRELITQVKWIKTRAKESSPQILLGSP